MTRQDDSELRKILDQHSLEDLLRIGLMLALRDNNTLTAYLLEMALMNYDGDSFPE